MTKAANTLVTPDPSGDIHRSRLEQADAPILALGVELRENRAAVDAESDRADALQEANPDDAETRAAAWAIRDAFRPMTVRFHEILNAMRDTPAYTVTGMAMKAEAIMHWLSPGGEVPDEHEDGRVAWSLARDVLRLAGVARHDGASPDAGLIATCAEFDRLEYGYIRLYYGASRLQTDEERDAADEASGRTKLQGELVQQIYDTRATTLEGWQAKARSAATWDLELLVTTSGNESEVILSSLVRDLIGNHNPVAIIEAEEAA